MKKIFPLLFFVFLLFPSPALANGAGLPPFFEINGKLSIPDPIQLYGITASTFLIPQDFAAENYQLNQPIDFKIVQEDLYPAIPQSYFNNVKYTWDFGDGQTASGLENSHTYTHIGSYVLILTINLYSSDNPQPTQFIDSFLLNILPNQNFNQLPQAVIKVDDQKPKSLSAREIDLNFSDSINYDGSESKGDSLEYMWNFGDGQTGTAVKTTHQYKDTAFKTVVLRIKDKNGFLSYDFVGLQNDSRIKTKNYTFLYLAAAVAVVGTGAIFFVIKKHVKA